MQILANELSYEFSQYLRMISIKLCILKLVLNPENT